MATTQRQAIPATQSDETDVRLGGRALGLALTWAVALAYVVVSQVPSAAVTLPFQDQVRGPIRAAATQGWAFFTKSPRDANVTALTSTTGQWASAMLAPHAEPRNAMGLNRASRAQGVEIGILMGALKVDNWVECDSSALGGCVAAVPPGERARVDNPMPSPTLCGPVVLRRQEPTPWAWAAEEGDAMPTSIAVLEVSCQ